METLTIRDATLNDIPLIRNIAMRTWPAAYSSILTAKQLEYMLATMYNIETLEEQLTSRKQLFILAYLGTEPIGFAGFGIVTEHPHTYKLHKLYVLPTVQKTGAGKFLLQDVEKQSVEHGATQLILNVNRNNKAFTFYQRMGFQIIEEVDLDIGKGFYMNDYVMSKILNG